MKKLKDLCLGVLINEGEEVFSLTPSEIERVLDINFDDEDIKIDFETTYGKRLNLVVKTKDFKKWFDSNRDKFKDIFRYFVMDLISKSKETTEEGLNEIVDDDGNIMGDDDMPNNSTNTMVVGPKFDLEKIYKSFVPKSIRFYSGNMGNAVITW